MFKINSIVIALIISFLLSACSNPTRIKEPSLSQKKNHNLKIVVQKGHSGAITSIAFSPDGKFFVSGSEDFNLVLWETSTGREVHTFRGHRDTVTSVAFSTDGQYIVSGSRDKTVRIWSISNYHKHVSLGQSETHVTAVAISPLGNNVVAGYKNGNIKRWSIPDGELLNDYRGHFQSDFAKERMLKWIKRGLTEKKDVRALVSSQLMYYKTKIGDFDLKGHLSSVIGISYSKKNRFFSVGRDGTIVRPLLFGGIIANKMKSNQSIIECIDFSPDGKSFATVDADNSIILWNLSSGKKIEGLIGFQQDIVSLAFSPDGHFLLIGVKGGKVSLYKISDGKKVRDFKSNRKQISVVKISPNGLYAAAGYADGIVQMWEVSSGRLIKTFMGKSVAANDVSIFSEGRYVVSAHNDGTLKLWNVLTGEQTLTYRGHTDSVTSISLSPDNQTIASGSADGNIIFWDVKSSKKTKIIQAHDTGVTCIEFSPNGNFILSAGKDNVISMWDIKSGLKIKDLLKLDFEITCIAISPNGSYLAIGTKGKTFKVLKLANETKEIKFSGHFRGVYALAFFHDGRYILSGGGDKAIRLWEVKTGQQKKVYQGHEKTVTSVIFSDNGRYILSGSNNGIIKSWDMNSGSVIKTIKGHAGQINSLVFSKKGNFIISAGADATMRKWTVGMENEVIRMHGSGNGEWATTTPDGYYKTSPEGKDLVHWVTSDNKETFSFEQFEPFTKKPNIIARRLAGDFTAGKPFPSLPQPAYLNFENHMGFVETSQKSYSVHLKIKGATTVKTVRLFTNGRPVIEVHIDKKEDEIRLETPLVFGVNRITAIAYDENGFSSNPKWVDVICNATGLSKPTLYALGIGISQYPKLSAQWQLEFAHTDAKNIVDIFHRQEQKLFNKVRSSLLTNRQANALEITEALDALSAIRENDIAIIFMAGHGVRDKDGTFYFLTSDGTSDNPKSGGISWNLLGEYLNRIKGRVILFLDACHSGSIVTETVVPNDELAQEFFSGKRGGVMVFSASKGRQYSMESPDIGGGFGIFTYALTQGLSARPEEADINGNGYVEFMELVDYVSQYVDKETNGAQTPWLSRKELFGDLAIAPVN